MTSIELANPGYGGEKKRNRAQAGGKIILAPAIRQLRRMTPGLVLAWSVLALVLAWAVFPGLFTGHDPLQGIAGGQLKPPSPEHLFGTDALGRDLYTRIVHGAVHSLSGALVAVGVGLAGGVSLGLLAGSLNGRIGGAIMRVVDVLLAIPTLLLSLSIIILLGFGTINVALAVGATAIAGFARLTRAEVMRVCRAEFVEAAFGSGGSFASVLWRHVLPNSLNAVTAYAAVQLGWAILQISTLGFLGFGAPPPTPEWGLLVAEGRNYLATAWWLTAIPGLVVVAVVLAANRISRSLGGRT